MNTPITDTVDSARSPHVAIPALLERQMAEGRGGDPYLEMLPNGDVLTFADMHRRSRIWAGRLADLGVGPGDRVAVFLPTCFESIECWAATAWIGAIEVPIHAELRGGMLRHVLDDSGAKVLIVAAEYLDRIEGLSGSFGALSHVVVVGDLTSPLSDPTVQTHRVADLTDEEFQGASPARRWDVSAIMYTSGTTGPAKGVMIPWGQWDSGLSGLFPDVGRDDCFYCPLPLHHIAGRGLVYKMAAVGGRVVLRERFSVSAYWDDVASGKCTATILMGAMAELLWRTPVSDGDRENTLQRVLMSPLLPQAEEFADRFGVKLRTNFGMTEIGGPIVGGVDRPLFDLKSCGRIRPGFECRVVDAHDEVVPSDVVGELMIRSAEPWCIMSGYWQDPEKTAIATRNQWFHTGDLFRQDADGNLYYVDRAKDVVRRRGENVSTFHLEQEILQHDDVAECAIVGVPSAETEEDIHAFVVLKPDAVLEPADLLAFLRPRVARFMVPRYWTLVDTLPRTATLRVTKSELRDRGLSDETWDANDSVPAPNPSERKPL